ncbi:hypothetical protein [Pseudalkalibacillus caeni]|uniref:Uncharacterized protein n=1 Tax=Exobacillus caeni TaxID=2574798 RepID=A0A5R9FF38_9BACL|nr:hypothetical protein [Pseudalkalibacillus caeni]TLS38195.1 hypothetical protein FCL54_06565 [Pseudalkalibacillus caeni]
MNRKVLYTIAGFVAGIALIYYSGTVTYLHKKEIHHGEVIEKAHNEDGYFVIVESKNHDEPVELKVKEQSTWNLVRKETPYHIKYTWFGGKSPEIDEIEAEEEKGE